MDIRKLREELLPEELWVEESQPEIRIRLPRLPRLPRVKRRFRPSARALAVLWSTVAVGCLVVGGLLSVQYAGLQAAGQVPNETLVAQLVETQWELMIGVTGGTQGAEQPAHGQPAAAALEPGQAGEEGLNPASPAPGEPGALLLTPAQPCGQPSLAVGPAQFHIETLGRRPDGSVQVPADPIGVAYLIGGDGPAYVLALGDTPENLALGRAVKTGDEAGITWADCTAEQYTVWRVESEPQDLRAVLEPVPGELVLFVPAGREIAGLVIRAGAHILPGAEPTAAVPPAQRASPTATLLAPPTAALPINALPTAVPTTAATPSQPAASTATPPAQPTAVPPTNAPPAPREYNIEAEISMQGVTRSADGTAVEVSVGIYNYGASAFDLTAGDLAVIDPSGAGAGLQSSDPPLPQSIRPGETRAYRLVFPHSGGRLPVLRIFNVEFDLEDF